MNIFVLDYNPVYAAHYHGNKHVLKMILESAQILSTAHHINGSWTDDMYKPTHIHHPCTRWAASNAANYLWLWELFAALLVEYTHRYGKYHKSGRVLGTLSKLPDGIPSSNELDPFAQAMPEQYQQDDAVQAYRNYYMGEKAHLAQYTNRDWPEWFVN